VNKSRLSKRRKMGSRRFALKEEEMQNYRSQTCRNKEEFGGQKEDYPGEVKKDSEEVGKMLDSDKYVP
jgi:hypothetical protein